jgi:hypothetical protein
MVQRQFITLVVEVVMDLMDQTQVVKVVEEQVTPHITVNLEQLIQVVAVELVKTQVDLVVLVVKVL